MAKRIRNSSNAYPRIKDTGSTFEKVDFAPIAEQLGAEEISAQILGSVNPVSFFALRERLQAELVSSGGRPGRREPVQRKKVPITEEEWSKLKEIATVMKKAGVSAAPGQIAGVMLRQRLEQLHTEHSDDTQAQTFRGSEELERQVDQIMIAAASAGIHVAGLRPVALDLLRDWNETIKE